MRELDVLLMRYMDEEYAGAGGSEQAAFVRLLSLQDPEILALLTGREVADDGDLRHVVKRLLESH